LPYSLSFLLVSSPSYLLSCVTLCIFSLVLPFVLFSGSHFFLSVYLILCSFPPSPIPLPTEKPLVSPFLHSISTVPPMLLFSYSPLLLLSLLLFFFHDGSYFLLYLYLLLLFVFSVSFFSRSFPFCFPLHSSISTSS
jgi:hypothetical protein